MTAIVLRNLTEKEVKDLRMLKLKRGDKDWRTFFMRIMKEWGEKNKPKKR